MSTEVEKLYEAQAQKFSFDEKHREQRTTENQQETLMKLYEGTGKKFDSDLIQCNTCKKPGDLCRPLHDGQSSQIYHSQQSNLTETTAFSRLVEILYNIERDTQMGHFLADSGSDHEVLGRLYKMVSDAKDKIVEICQGKFGRKNLRLNFVIMYDSGIQMDAVTITETALTTLELLKKRMPIEFPAMETFNRLLEDIYQLKDVASRK
jgi:hypothetical protein